MNQHRRSRGLAELRYDERVAGIAQAHSREMAAGRVPLGHAGFDDRADEIARAVRFGAIAENVALNDYPDSATADTAVAGWLRSAGHRANIEGDYDLTGVGVAVDGRGTFYYTQIFVRRIR